MKNKLKLVSIAIFVFSFNGCGTVQTLSNGTKNIFSSIFTRDIKELHLDFAARAQLNPVDKEAPASLVIRIYQLTNNQHFENISYVSLLCDDQKALAVDLLDQHEVVLRPTSAISLDVPLAKNAAYIGVAGFFIDVDDRLNDWKIVIKREELHLSKPRLIIAS